MLSELADPEKIEARGIQHVHTGKSENNYLMLLLSLKNGQLQYKSFEDDSLLLKFYNRHAYVIELAQDMYMIDELII